jgi:HD-like signal output (HDOD) protein/ActR/RegA family two-component response regulator
LLQRVLFVDDEVGVLQGLQRLLFEMDEWDMVFVDSGEKALEALSRGRFDVIVSDMCMPGMDGAMLLARVHAEHPAVVRIILTGHSELEATFRAMPVAHSFLTKPCKPGLVQQIIGKCCSLASLLDNPALRTLAGSIVSLPVQPHIHAQLLEAVADTRADMARIAALVRADVGLSSKVLHLTNSAFFGAPCSFVSVDRALAYIGPGMFRRLVLARRVFGTGGDGLRLDAISLEGEQRHAALCADLAYRIAPRPELRDDAFLAGLFHDVGTLIWASREADAEAHADAPSRECRARLGAYLLGLWGLERHIVDAVAYHRDPAMAADASARAAELATVVHVAEGLARALDDERSGGGGELTIDVGHLERMGALGKLDEWRQMSRTLGDRESA